MPLTDLPLDVGGIDLSLSSIMSGLIFGIIGIWLFRRGKRQANLRILCVGLTLMFYPYFTKGPWADWGVGLALCGLAYYWH